MEANWLDKAIAAQKEAKQAEREKVETDIAAWQEPSAAELNSWNISLVVAYCQAMDYARQQVWFNTRFMYGYQAAQEIERLAKEVKDANIETLPVGDGD